MKTKFMILAFVSLAACEVPTTETDPAEPLPLPPYPPGYEVAGARTPEVVLNALPPDVTPEQVLITDDGCFFYHRGATTYPVTAGAPNQRFCAEREPFGQIINIPNT